MLFEEPSDVGESVRNGLSEAIASCARTTSLKMLSVFPVPESTQLRREPRDWLDDSKFEFA